MDRQTKRETERREVSMSQILPGQGGWGSQHKGRPREGRGPRSPTSLQVGEGLVRHRVGWRREGAQSSLRPPAAAAWAPGRQDAGL